LRGRAPHGEAQGPALGREVPRGGRAVTGSGRFDLRRRADDLSGAAGARLRDHPPQAADLSLHERAAFGRERSTA
jgi:hypothetical protein